jgi:hypothetical protein
MSWYCEYCSGENNAETYTCEHCGYEYAEYYDGYGHDELQGGFLEDVEEDVPRFKTFKKKSVCDNCYHKHFEGEYCHVFIEKEVIIEDPDDNDENSDNGDFSGSDGDISIKDEEVDNASLKPNQKLLGTKQEVEVEPLPTPQLIGKCGFERCNCNVGIPAGDSNFIPLPKPYYVDDIKILTYEFQSAEAPKDLMGHAYDRNIQKLNNAVADFMPLILQFIPLSLCANPAVTCTSWNYGANMYGDYVDVRNCVPWQVYRPHNAQVGDFIIFIEVTNFTSIPG